MNSYVVTIELPYDDDDSSDSSGSSDYTDPLQDIGIRITGLMGLNIMLDIINPNTGESIHIPAGIDIRIGGELLEPVYDALWFLEYAPFEDISLQVDVWYYNIFVRKLGSIREMWQVLDTERAKSEI